VAVPDTFTLLTDDEGNEVCKEALPRPTQAPWWHSERCSARPACDSLTSSPGWTRVNFYAHDLSGKNVEFTEVIAMIKDMVVLLRQAQTYKLVTMITRTVVE